MQSGRGVGRAGVSAPNYCRVAKWVNILLDCKIIICSKVKNIIDFDYLITWSLPNPSKLGVSQIHWSYANIIFLACFARQGVLNENQIVLMEGARPPQIGLNMNSTNSKCYKLGQKIIWRTKNNSNFKNIKFNELSKLNHSGPYIN